MNYQGRFRSKSRGIMRLTIPAPRSMFEVIKMISIRPRRTLDLRLSASSDAIRSHATRYMLFGLYYSIHHRRAYVSIRRSRFRRYLSPSYRHRDGSIRRHYGSRGGIMIWGTRTIHAVAIHFQRTQRLSAQSQDLMSTNLRATLSMHYAWAATLMTNTPSYRMGRENGGLISY